MFEMNIAIAKEIADQIYSYETLDISDDDNECFSILKKICEQIEEHEDLKFHLIAFGKHWPTDVRTDLVSALEALPGLLTWLKQASTAPFSFDFYEQGMELFLTMVRSGSNVEISYATYSDHQLNPPIEFVAVDDLIKMSENICSIFISVVHERYPYFASDISFVKWERSVNLVEENVL